MDNDFKLKKIEKKNHKPNTSYSYHSEKYIGEISKFITPFYITHSCMDVKKFFKENEDVEGTCILNGKQVAGLIMKNHLDATLSGQYGYSLYAKKPITKVMDSDCLNVDFFTPINDVANLVMSRHPSKIYDNIIVTKELEYWGIVSVIELLRQFLEMERNSALDLNPLTGLPGNALINKALICAIDSPVPKVVLYIDLDNFKAYNDAYGFENGDHIIKMTKDAIMTSITMNHTFSHFIGHIGGDDFIAIIECNCKEGEIICQQIINYYQQHIANFFNLEDRKRGYIQTRDRNKVLRKFNLTTISIAGIYGNLNCFDLPDSLAQHMSSIKKKAKEIDKNSFIVESATQDNTYIAKSI